MVGFYKQNIVVGIAIRIQFLVVIFLLLSPWELGRGWGRNGTIKIFLKNFLQSLVIGIFSSQMYFEGKRLRQ